MSPSLGHSGRGPILPMFSRYTFASPMPPRISPALLCVGLGLTLLLVGCGDETELDVAEGRYRLHVEGGLTDTLTGPAVLDSQRDGRLGIELGKRDGPGMSIELVPPPSDSGRYEVVAAELLHSPPSDNLTGLIAFLSVTGAQFTATNGFLSVTHVDDESVAGTLDVEMEEQGSTGDRSVRVRGVLRASDP